MSALNAYLDAIDALVARIRERQTEAIQRAADLCAELIAKDGLIHLFGSGHSRIFVEEIYPVTEAFPASIRSWSSQSPTTHKSSVRTASGRRCSSNA